ncbi:MAG: ribosome maturation factor RimP [Deltaproteobacteria bacterium]|uniref:Ribosome maturation factor RimP n=1 Tax=Candidatus Zymogenus saltonus TaxID=2844893 RepID=A0A9D8KGV6_9DELT|nr:ribosome maturation factor RimP [Candidatus Zymogenus saltonus]
MEQEGIFEGLEGVLWRIGEKACDLHGLSLVELEVQRGKGKWLVRFYIDREGPEGGGVDVEDCAEVSRAISKMLDAKDPIDSPYTMEVSSPGLERPLRREEDFRAYTGSEVKIRVREPLKERKNFTGTILGVSGEGVLIREGTEEELSIPLKNIKRARLIYRYE